MNIERSADELDMASEMEMIFNEEAQQAVAARLQPETHPDFDGRHCIECEDELPELRLTMGRIHCVSCQQRIENEKKVYGRQYD